MSFTSHFKRYPAFWITVLLVILLEAVMRIAPSQYGLGAGMFLSEHRRILAASPGPEFDYVVLGDSRSLSLMGHPPTPEEDYSLYNFSMPAMGPRYYKYFLRKIVESRKHKPSAVILAADPTTYQKGWNAPLHDPVMRYSDGPDDSLWKYLYYRVVNRIQMIFHGDKKKQSLMKKEMAWDFFSHRYLRLFSPAELFGQYTGAERIFILYEAAPLQYATYRYRDTLWRAAFDPASQFHWSPVPEYCNTCEGLKRPECRKTLSHFQDNIMLEQGLKERYGQINLADRLTFQQHMAYLAVKDRQIKRQVKGYNRSKPDLHFLEDFIKDAGRLGLKVVLTDMPAISEYKNTRFYKEYFDMLPELAKKYPHVKIIRFPQPYYSKDLFVEQVHYECKGAEKLNLEFYRDVMPRILDFAPVHRDNRKRSFQG